MDYSALLEGLNDNQKLAVTSTEGFVRVIAGAGSGKTKTLVNRYAYIVEALGISPSNILCVTFTNKAAGEMRKRVKKILNNTTDGSMICTYHGFCVKVLREDIHHINYPKNFIILDDEDQKDILKEIYEELGLTVAYNSFNKILDFINTYKLNYSYVELLTNPAKILEIPTDGDINKKIIYMYLQKQRKYFALDFMDLMNFVLYLYDNFPDILLKWQKKLLYVQVDEFQDSSDRQIGLINLLTAVNKNLFVVGDPDQCIYGWRGADPAYLVNFDKVHTPCKSIILNENYRSTPEILNLGNAVIKNNETRIDKDLFTHNKTGFKAVHYHGKNDYDEIQWISSAIKKLVDEENAAYGDIAILYRANYLSRFVEQGFIRNQIPYTMYGGFKFFQRKEIKDCLAYLKVIAYEDDMSFLRVINSPKRNFGKTRITFIKERAEADNLSYYQTLLKYQNTDIIEKTKASVFINVIEKYKMEYKNLSISDLLRKLLDESGYDEELRTSGDTDRIDNVQELLTSMVNFEKDSGEEIDLIEYLQHISLYTDDDRAEKSDAVKLMTIHTAKGLEFPHVILVGFNDGILPSYRSLDSGDKRHLEEERRLTYVAITRAMKSFFMTESEGMTNQGKVKIPSRFVFEVKEALFDRHGVIDNEFLIQAREIISNSQKQPSDHQESSGTLLQVNDKVKHPIFGAGTIQEVNSSDNTYIVYFEDKDFTRPINQNFKGLVKN